MRRVLASALFAGVLAAPFGAQADEAQTPVALSAEPVVASPPKPNAAKVLTAPAQAQAGPKGEVSPVAVTAKRAHARLDLRLTPGRLNEVLSESGVEPVAETETPVEAVEVTARRVQMEPITQGIPALYYGITHPSEAWRIFAPIQP
jgi:hypothetical protein